MSSTQSTTLSLPNDDEFVEKEVLPGVFLTDYRSQGEASAHSAVALEIPLVAALDGVDFTEIEDLDADSIGPQERQLAPGVYMSDFRDAKSGFGHHSQITSFGAPVFGDLSQFAHPELADARVQELLNSIKHLERSNAELEEMKATDEDPVWQETIDENMGVISRQKEEIRRILLKHANNAPAKTS